MFNFIVTIFRVVFLLFSSRHMDIVIKNSILKKENEILKRKKRIGSNSSFLTERILYLESGFFRACYL